MRHRSRRRVSESPQEFEEVFRDMYLCLSRQYKGLRRHSYRYAAIKCDRCSGHEIEPRVDAVSGSYPIRSRIFRQRPFEILLYRHFDCGVASLCHLHPFHLRHRCSGAGVDRVPGKVSLVSIDFSELTDHLKTVLQCCWAVAVVMASDPDSVEWKIVRKPRETVRDEEEADGYGRYERTTVDAMNLGWVRLARSPLDVLVYDESEH